MLAQANVTRDRYQPAAEDMDSPIYGGLDNSLSRDMLNKKKVFKDASYDFYIKNRASERLRTDRNNARALAEIGDLHFNKNAFPRASAAYINSLKANPNNISVYDRLIKSLVARGKIKEADSFFRQLLDLVDKHPKYVSEYLTFRLSQSSISPLFLDETRSIMQSFRDLYDDRVLNSIGVFELAFENNVRDAKELFQKALHINPDNVDLNNNYAICFRLEKDYPKAEYYFEHAHRLNKNYVAAYENLASLYYEEGKKGEAIATLEKAIEADVELSSDGRHNLAMLYLAEAKYEKAINEYNWLAKNEPQNGLIMNNVGVAYLKLGKKDYAKDYFKKAVEQTITNNKSGIPYDGRHANAFISLIQRYLEDAEYSNAAVWIEHAHSLFPQHNTFYHQEGLMQLWQKHYDEAKVAFEKSLELNPKYVDSAINYSFILEDIDFNYSAALKCLLKFTEENIPDVRKVLFNNIAYAYLKLGEIQKSKEYLVEQDTSYASFATKGLYYLLSGNSKKSEIMYAKAFKVASRGFQYQMSKQFYFFEKAEYALTRDDQESAINYAKKGIKYEGSPKVRKRLGEIISIKSV